MGRKKNPANWIDRVTLYKSFKVGKLFNSERRRKRRGGGRREGEEERKGGRQAGWPALLTLTEAGNMFQ